ncbi:hypothetical protein BKA56DRAFT_113799 [Ilyonectria sp. MPI-CAGE-AT-0026]|nr:hypothetical protein BKA56DRAFT_113799 [Ilyonectria sp. MPI-CAGE-AT-0026]
MAPLASWRRFVVPCVQLQPSSIHSAVTLGRFRRAKTAQQGLGTVLCNQAEWLEWFEYGGHVGHGLWVVDGLCPVLFRESRTTCTFPLPIDLLLSYVFGLAWTR